MAVKITSGELRYQVTLKSPTEVKNDESGYEVTGYTDQFTTMAAIKAVSGRRIVEANAEVLLHSRDFYLRWTTARQAITKDWILTYNGSDYTIHEIEMMDQGAKFIRLTAKAKTSG